LSAKGMGYIQSLQDMQSSRDGLDCSESSVSAVQSCFAAGLFKLRSCTESY
jgi:hypothetical protein